MPRLSLSAAAALCGAALLGWSLGGMASVDRRLQAASSPTRAPHHHLVAERGHECRRL